MTIEDYLKVIGAMTVFVTVALPTFYVTVLRPLLTQIKELIIAAREVKTALAANTEATDTSAQALTTLAPAVEANTVVTQAVADAAANPPPHVELPATRTRKPPA